MKTNLVATDVYVLVSTTNWKYNFSVEHINFYNKRFTKGSINQSYKIVGAVKSTLRMPLIANLADVGDSVR